MTDDVSGELHIADLTMAHVGRPSTPVARMGHRVLHWLGFFNNVLMIPMFTLMILEVGYAGRDFDIYRLENLFFCLCFQVEYWFGFALSSDRRAYLRAPSNILDFLSAVPVGFLFQGLRFARLYRLLRVARLVWRIRRFRGRGDKLVRAAGLVCSLVFAGALALRIVEPAATDSFEESLWWAIVTLSTVGYGDVMPTTSGGRAVAAVVIICGIGVFGYMAGFMTSLIEDPDEDEILTIVRDLRVQVARLTSDIQELKDR